MPINGITRQVVPSRPIAAQAAPPVASARAATGGVSAKSSTVKDPFASVEIYLKAVDATEAAIKQARTGKAAAESQRAKVDRETGEKLREAIAVRDARNAEAVKPLDEAKQALETRRKALQAPIDETQGRLAGARWDLELATHPNKVEHDQARQEAHGEVGRRENALGDAQRYLDEVETALDRARRSLASNRSGLDETRRDLSNTQSRLSSTQSSLSSARWSAPSQYDLDQSARRVNAADQEVRNAASEVDSASREVSSRRSELERLLSENDRPTPPSVGDRPTPPGTSDRPSPPPIGGRPTPPGSGDRPAPPPIGRPTPPSIDPPHSSADIGRARSALGEAERRRDRAEDLLGSARSELEAARRSHGEKRARFDHVVELEAAVRALESEVLTLNQNVRVYEQNIRTIDGNIRDLESDRPVAIQGRDTATRNLQSARAEAERLEATPYQQGEAPKIKAAQLKVDRLDGTLKTHQATYTEGLKAPTQRVATEQATYEGIMTPLRQAVTEAGKAQEAALKEADQVLSGANRQLQQVTQELEKLKDVPGGKELKWKMPKWLGGSGFDVDKFWRERPAV